MMAPACSAATIRSRESMRPSRRRRYARTSSSGPRRRRRSLGSDRSGCIARARTRTGVGAQPVPAATIRSRESIATELAAPETRSPCCCCFWFSCVCLRTDNPGAERAFENRRHDAPCRRLRGDGDLCRAALSRPPVEPVPRGPARAEGGADADHRRRRPAAEVRRRGHAPASARDRLARGVRAERRLRQDRGFARRQDPPRRACGARGERAGAEGEGHGPGPARLARRRHPAGHEGRHRTGERHQRRRRLRPARRARRRAPGAQPRAHRGLFRRAAAERQGAGRRPARRRELGQAGARQGGHRSR